jgi:hypothetical protein
VTPGHRGEHGADTDVSTSLGHKLSKPNYPWIKYPVFYFVFI